MKKFSALKKTRQQSYQPISADGFHSFYQAFR